MKYTYLHFMSEIGFSLFIDGEYVDCCECNNSITIATINSSISYIICPKTENLSYAVDSGIIQIDSNIISASSGCINIVKFDNDNYNIEFVPQSVLKLSNYNIVNQNTIDGFNVIVYNSAVSFIDIFLKDCIVLKESISCNIEACDITKINKYIMVECALSNSRRYILIYDKTEKEKKLAIECDSYEVVDNNIQILIDLKTVLNIAKVISFDFVAGEETEDFIFLDEEINVSNKFLVPYAFLTAVKVGCFKLAKKYLVGELKDVDDIYLKRFFGDIDKFYFDSYRNDEKVLYAVKSDKVKLYEFVVDEGKIVDILDK